MCPPSGARLSHHAACRALPALEPGPQSGSLPSAFSVGKTQAQSRFTLDPISGLLICACLLIYLFPMRQKKTGGWGEWPVLHQGTLSLKDPTIRPRHTVLSFCQFCFFFSPQRKINFYRGTAEQSLCHSLPFCPFSRGWKRRETTVPLHHSWSSAWCCPWCFHMALSIQS